MQWCRFGSNEDTQMMRRARNGNAERIPTVFFRVVCRDGNAMIACAETTQEPPHGCTSRTLARIHHARL